MMKSTFSLMSASCLIAAAFVDMANADMVKMCLFYKAAGHVRTDPILSQSCVSDHVHTFYGPQLFHPNTTNADLRNSDPRYSTSPYVENKSLYWHPSIYKVGKDVVTDEPTYELAEISFSGPYYRWDKAAPLPAVEAFPPGFQMIAGMNPDLAGVNLFSECLCPRPCTRSDGLCDSDSNFFPSMACGEMGIAMTFPTCWDDSKGLGDTGDHMSHMAYTVDGTVEGACPPGYNRRLPQIQLFVRISNYEGGKYTFSDNTLASDTEVFHADFMNGWTEGALENIVDNCQPLPGTIPGDYNPPCNCEEFLTKKSTVLTLDNESPGRNDAEAAKVCPIDVTNHIVNEEINFAVGGLPRGSCSATLIDNVAPTFVNECGLMYTPNTFDEENCTGGNGGGGDDEDEGDDRPTPTARPTLRSTARPTARPTLRPTARPITRPTLRPTARPTPIPTDPAPVSEPVDDEDEDEDEDDSDGDGDEFEEEEEESGDERGEEEDEADNEDEDEEEEDCEDDDSFLFRGIGGKDCEWIGRKEIRTERLCQKRSVSLSCKMTCGECP